MKEYVNCQHCINKRCARYGGPYGYTFCDSYIQDTPKEKTNADRIRSMSDEELAELFEQIVSQRDHYLLKKLQEAGIDAELYEMPEASKKKHLDWLRQPAGGEQHG